MTTKQKEIIVKNLGVLGVKAGKSVKGKGLEVIERDKYFDYSWSTAIEDGSFLSRVKAKIEKDPTLLESLVVTEFYQRTEDSLSGRYLKKGEFPSIQDVVFGDALKMCTEIRIEKVGSKLYGYIPLSKYDAYSYYSMCTLVRDVNALMGYKTADEVLDDHYCEFDNIITFKDDGEWSKSHDNYGHIHGGLMAWEPRDNGIIDQDWRVSNYNDGVVEDFWNFGLDSEQNYLKSDLDPEGQICVYHYKGKKGHFGYSLNQEAYELCYLDEDGEEQCDLAIFLTWKEDVELLNKVADVFKSSLKDVEVKGYIFNELRERNDSDWSYNDNIFNLDLIDTMYDGDRIEFAYTLVDYVDYEKVTDDWKSPAREVQKAYEMWLERKVIGKADNGRFEEFSSLVEGTGYVLTKTPIPNTEYMQHCVAYKGEEYHFMLGELLGAESAESFFEKVREALAKRLLEKLEHTALVQKSANVFVGLQDSLDSGNCNAGTVDFCHRHHIDTNVVGGLRGDVILGMEFSNFTRRAVMQAIVRQGGAA